MKKVVIHTMEILLLAIWFFWMIATAAVLPLLGTCTAIYYKPADQWNAIYPLLEGPNIKQAQNMCHEAMVPLAATQHPHLYAISIGLSSIILSVIGLPLLAFTYRLSRRWGIPSEYEDSGWLAFIRWIKIIPRDGPYRFWLNPSYEREILKSGK